jgi:hypothetical protein
MRAAAQLVASDEAAAGESLMRTSTLPVLRMLLALSLACAGDAANAQAFDAVRLYAVPLEDGQGLAGLEAFYGVSAAQSASSGYAVYAPGTGWRDVRGTASLTYFLDADWSLTGAVTVRALQGDVKRSPIVNEDTPVAGVLALNDSS